MIAAGKLSDVEWPRYKNEREKMNSGVLPVENHEIDSLADKGHKFKSFSRQCFALCKQETESPEIELHWHWHRNNQKEVELDVKVEDK